MEYIRDLKYGYILPDGSVKKGGHSTILENFYKTIKEDKNLNMIFEKYAEDKNMQHAKEDFPVAVLGWIKVGSDRDSEERLTAVYPAIDYNTKNEWTRRFVDSIVRQMEKAKYCLDFIPYEADEWRYREPKFGQNNINSQTEEDNERG